MAGFDPISAVSSLVETAVKRIFPDPAQKDAAILALKAATDDGRLKELGIQMSAIVAEAQSSDPWTSRARPSFLYVMYFMILMSVPMGILSAIKPELAVTIATGMKAWLAAVPDMLWGVFGTGYMGYTVARSVWDKQTGK